MEKAKRVLTQTFGTVGALIEKGGKILLVREAPGKFDAGKWNIPEGWIDVGEDPQEAAKREVKEETGFTLRPTYLLGIYSMVREDLRNKIGAVPHAIKIVFLGDVDYENHGDLHDDISETRWFLPEEIESMSTETLRNSDIKKIVRDYLAGKHYPLELLQHTVQ